MFDPYANLNYATRHNMSGDELCNDIYKRKGILATHKIKIRKV